jgi:hypothetical protein
MWHLNSRQPALALALAALLFGGNSMGRLSRASEAVAGPRAAVWQAVEQAIEEGKPKSALAALAGVEQAAAADKAWAEVARAIATRVLTETGDRAGDDSERVVRLAAEIDTAPPETRCVLAAIEANWIWGYYQMNQWRYRQRTQGGVHVAELSTITEWDLPTILAEVRRRFRAALGDAGGPERKTLQGLPVAEWTALIEPGSMGDAYRPTVWDVVVRDAIEFAASGERGLMAPEDAFELAADSPALGTLTEFVAWNPTADDSITDRDSPLLEVAALYQGLIEFHRDGRDHTALLAADLDRILWAAGAAVGEGVTARKQAALEAFLAHAGDHETAALARFHLASLAREEGDLVAAHRLAQEAAASHPTSPGGGQAANLVADIEAKELSLATERAWAAPWPTVRVDYRNLEKVHLRLCRADWKTDLAAGRLGSDWVDDDTRARILAIPALREHAADLPATPEYQDRSEELAVDAAFDVARLEPGAYWLVASHRPDFAADDNVISLAQVWITRLAIVTEQHRQILSGNSGQRQSPSPQGTVPLAGHVVDLATGEPVANATVRAFLRQSERNQRSFIAQGPDKTDASGRFELTPPAGREFVVVATASITGQEQTVTSERQSLWPNESPATAKSIVLVTDRGIHRPGQIVFYKGIAWASDSAAPAYGALGGIDVGVTLRDANGRDVATARHTTTANGSLSGSFSIPAGCLPGQWSIQASGGGAAGATGVRVEEYKRPKFQVKLAAPTASVSLGSEASLAGKAETYTGLPVADATVRWRVERTVRFPGWCRWIFPWLPFDGGSQRIARGAARTDAAGSFTIRFPAKPDAAVPANTLPVFSYRVVADVTDPGGETRSDERLVNLGYTDVEARLEAADWQATAALAPADVAITVATTTLDGQPRAATGTLTLRRLVQPAEVDRGSLTGSGPEPRRGRRRGPAAPLPPDPASPETWEAGEAVSVQAVTTQPATGTSIARVPLAAGIYRATFEIPAVEAMPAVKATRLVEVVDPTATAYPVKRAFVLTAAQTSVEPGDKFQALVGTGYAQGRALIEISQSGKVLERHWTEPGRTQWPVSFAVTPANRGGFTVRTWLVRDGRLHSESRTVAVPWTDKQFSIAWERFTRKTQPGAKEVWRAKITSMADPVDGPAAAELLALLYDQSLDALATHGWPADGLLSAFRSESSGMNLAFTNSGESLRQILGGFDRHVRALPAVTYRRLRDPFGSPQQFGLAGGFGGGMRNRRFGFHAEPAMSTAFDAADAEAMPARMMAKGVTETRQPATPVERGGQGNDGPPSAGQTAASPPPRKNLVETAFFLPTLTSDADGIVAIEFTLPDTLTTWQFKGLAHDAALRSGTLADTCVSTKDLMVEPLMPRFVRVGDQVRIPVKVSNTSTGKLTGSVRFTLVDARTDASCDTLVAGLREQPFDVPAGESRIVSFTVHVADGTDVLRYLVTGTAGKAADGEEAFLPVLPRRVPVTETVPLTIRGPGERTVTLDRLAASAESDIESCSLVIQAASNPAWYAVLALPVIIEETDESTEALFARLFANSLARHLAASDPRIGRIFEQWKGTAALESPLEKNTDLMQTLLAETPWVRDAVDEREARARIALLFDPNRAETEARAAVERLESLRSDDGGWPWFPGGRTCDPVTLGIIAGFGRLRAAGVPLDVQPALAALPWLDERLVEEKRRAEARWPNEPDEIVLTPIGVYALYARSFFTTDAPPEADAAAAIRWAFDVGCRSWMKLGARRSQGQLAIALKRSGDAVTAASIIDSLKQRAVDADVKRGAEPEAWQGMWWRDEHPAWWSWASAPIATQAIMIEAFDEVAGDAEAVEALKVWLLSQKRTSRWPGSRATADAVGALLGRGDDLLGSRDLVSVKVGTELISPADVEVGTGFFETRFVRQEITPALATITLTKPDQGLAFGGIHWQYLDDIASVPAAGREELAIRKQLFVKRQTKTGPELVPVADSAVAVGDELVVRLVVTSDREYEFLELTDHRPCLTEPVDILSGWRFGDGVNWYGAVRDAATEMFFERLPRGSHVFEYALRAAHQGQASSGFARIQSRYAPEFSAHSASIPLEVRSDQDRDRGDD